MSVYYDQTDYVNRDGVMSTTCFTIKIDDNMKCLGKQTDYSLSLQNHGDG